MKNITSIEAKQMLDDNEAILIDVREPDEFLLEYIPGSQLLPLSLFLDNYKKIDNGDKKIIFSCKGGVRSAKACIISKDFFDEDDIYNMIDGIDGWKALGFEIKTNYIKP